MVGIGQHLFVDSTTGDVIVAGLVFIHGSNTTQAVYRVNPKTRSTKLLGHVAAGVVMGCLNGLRLKSPQYFWTCGLDHAAGIIKRKIFKKCQFFLIV